jgi:hypothetical protein
LFNLEFRYYINIDSYIFGEKHPVPNPQQQLLNDNVKITDGKTQPQGASKSITDHFDNELTDREKAQISIISMKSSII